jgi:hypothetical protein
VSAPRLKFPKRPKTRKRRSLRHDPRLIRRRHRREFRYLAGQALAALVDRGDFYAVGNTEFLVAPVDDDLIQAIASVLGAAEDDEPDSDSEPSLGWTAGGSVGYSQLPHVLAAGYRGGTTGEYAIDDEGEHDRSDCEPDHDNEPEWYLDG